MPALRKVISFIIIVIQTSIFAQSDNAYSFIVAGHAYGAHSGTNLGLHPPLLSSLTSGFPQNTTFIVLTGDIVNTSTTESWEQVEAELMGFGLESWYVMGNHDNNSVGYDVFENKHGSAYYAFNYQSELYIILNSTESDRSISNTQLSFLDEQISQADESINNVFVFFHEVIWNSKDKYRSVRSNSRSRYANVIDHSNYWDEVHPICTAYPEKNFCMISGDVGGNTDAIAAFYDTCDNVTLISSGMGEVVDENYLLVNVIHRDSIVFEPVPLNSEVILDPIENYSVPPAPDTILYNGPISNQRDTVIFKVPEVFNADSYFWELPPLTSGSSNSNSIIIEFEEGFESGTLSIYALRDGFGSSPPYSHEIEMHGLNAEQSFDNDIEMQLDIFNNENKLQIYLGKIKGDELAIRIFDVSGKMILNRNIDVMGQKAEIIIPKSDLQRGIHLLSISSGYQNIVKKLLIY